MKKFLLIASGLLLLSCTRTVDVPESPLHVSCGKLYRMELKAEKLGLTLPIDIWTPTNYTVEKQYPVIYMHDGQNLFDAESTWNHQSWEIDSVMGVMGAQAIVVGIHSNGETRIGDMMPNKLQPLLNDTSLRELDNYCPQGFHGDEYLDFIVHTVKPAIDTHFSTLSGREHTSIMGSSMGGLISLYAITEYPEVFGSAGCISSHINNPNEHGGVYYALAEYLRQCYPTQLPLRIYLDNGSEGDDADYDPYFPLLVNLLDSLGNDNTHIEAHRFPTASHCERDWAKRVEIPLTFLLQEK